MKVFAATQIGAWTLVRQPSDRVNKWKAISGRRFGYGNTKKAAIADARKGMR